MARNQFKYTHIFFFCFIFFSHIISVKSEPQHPFSQALKPTKLGLKKTEKLSHLHFYFHNIVTGPNPTAAAIIPATTNLSKTGFGFTVMIDDPLTQGPSIKSKLVGGRAQGMYGVASQNELSLVMVINFAFMEGKFNGSTLSILGRNRVFDKVREFPIVGGSGVFRFARGYAQAHTHIYNVISGDSVTEYNVYVLHY